MNTTDFAAGDNGSTSSGSVNNLEEEIMGESDQNKQVIAKDLTNERKIEVTSQDIDKSELKLKGRIAQCRNIIESLKLELKEEKEKQEDHKVPNSFESIVNNNNTNTSFLNSYEADGLKLPNDSTPNLTMPSLTLDNHNVDDLELTNSIFNTYVDSKLNYSVNINEYEKQLEKYQNTLNLAQTEKKNAIRKQMLAKAFKLKLLEVENQCNIELLRVKQSLQCLEPLKMIASKWKSSSDEIYDTNNFELMPRFPEFDPHSGYDFHSFREDFINISNSDVRENSPH